MKKRLDVKKLVTLTAAILIITSSMPLFAETKDNSVSKVTSNSVVSEKKLSLVKHDKIKDYNYYFYDAVPCIFTLFTIPSIKKVATKELPP